MHTRAPMAVVPVVEGSLSWSKLGGRTLLARAVDALQGCHLLGQIVVAAEPGRRDTVHTAVSDAASRRPPVTVIEAPRSGTFAALSAALAWSAGPALGQVLVFDPQYALAGPELVTALLEALSATPGAVAAAPVAELTDTIKQVDADDVVLATANRDLYQVILGPQAYQREALATALAGLEGAAAHPGDDLTLLWAVPADRAAMVAVPGSPGLCAVRTADDILLAEALLSARAS